MSAAAETLSTELKDKISAIFEKNSRAMTSMVASQLGVSEEIVVRHLPAGRAFELDATRAQDLIKDFEPLGKVHVIVNSGSVVLEAMGQFGGFSLTGPFLNVQTDSLDMHISINKLKSAFAVIKQSHMDGFDTLSFQFFNPEGVAAFKTFLTFGGSVPNPERVTQFNTLREKYALAKREA